MDDKLKVLISGCLLGQKVRWNLSDKSNSSIKRFAEDNNIELVPICPENELFGTPRAPIRLIQIEDKIEARMKGRDVSQELNSKCQSIIEDSGADGFIGIHGSPTCGLNVGVKNLGRTVKGSMHALSEFPTTEISQLKNPQGKTAFLNRLVKHRQNSYNRQGGES